MVAMLRFLETQAHDGYVVIFDDLKRFARDTIFHLKLRQELAAYGATVECPNFKFEDTPEGQFVETVIAAQGRLERLQNRRQTLQKMKARLERGYYVFATPVGYRRGDGLGVGAQSPSAMTPPDLPARVTYFLLTMDLFARPISVYIVTHSKGGYHATPWHAQLRSLRTAALQRRVRELSADTIRTSAWMIRCWSIRTNSRTYAGTAFASVGTAT